MFKKLFILVLFVLLLNGCSNEAKNRANVAKLEKDLERIYERLEEKENEIKALNQQVDENNDKKFIKIPKDDAPQLWNHPDIQLWEYVMDFSFAEENDWNRGHTNWRKWDGAFDRSLSLPNQTWQTPGMLMSAFMTDVEMSYWLGEEVWEINTRISISDEGNAEGYILSYGFLDDAIAGRDMKLKMRRDNGFWYIEFIEERENCSRDVSDNKELCV